VLPVATLCAEGHIIASENGDSFILPNGQHIQLSDYRSCYARLVDVSSALPCDQRERFRAHFYALSMILQRTNIKVINPPLFDAGNNSKLHQIQSLARHGFRIPSSLCTNSPAEAKRFCEEFGLNVVYKSTSSVRSIVTAVTQETLLSIENVRSAPVLFQQRIVGPDVRVHVVGEHIFAERINSTGIDYRYACKRTFAAMSIPPTIATLCITFTRDNGLIFAGFDFKIDRGTGEFFCLEANPMPGYEGYDFRLGGVISDALFNELDLHH
jgi:glutathione synthase/RimK-type ligase-like ATP-grasp enzyme